jgi:hypothetical protein
MGSQPVLLEHNPQFQIMEKALEPIQCFHSKIPVLYKIPGFCSYK